ncbi:hypothetical protein [Longispora albida]|uniref:hypothetical protein n=1 Tax=Longispora albida TaxID=203523 RepID=UPI00036BB9D2|nr:hypothetical protein [Longispora albida]
MDLGALAQSGAAAVVAVMATDAWGQVRSRLAVLLGGGDAQREQENVLQLEESRATLVSSAGKREVVEAELRGQFRDRLRSDPVFAAEFAVLAEEIRRTTPDAAVRPVYQHGVASRGGTVIQAGRDVNGMDAR